VIPSLLVGLLLMKAAGVAVSWIVVLAPLAVIPASIVALYLFGLTAVTLKWAISKAEASKAEQK
jgi:hypothetical protein